MGGAGTGKTRLAFELLLRVNGNLPEWQAGLLTGSVLRKFDATKQPADFSWPGPTLLIVDYAQTLAGPLTELLRALTHKRRAGLPPLRLLLLERQPGDWFDDLFREEDSAGPCAVGKLFEPPAPVQLTPLPEGELRRKVLQQTLASAAQFNHKPARVLPPEGNKDYDASLKRELFAQPLNLMLAALAAGELGLLPALTRSRIQLAEAMAQRELARVTQGEVLVEMKHPAEAVSVLGEAVRLLWPHFLQLPGAFAHLMRPLASLYWEAAQAAQIEPDSQLLTPVREVLRKFHHQVRPRNRGHEPW